MRWRRSNAVKIRATAASICGNKNGLLNDFRRGRRKFSTSTCVVKPFRISNLAMHTGIGAAPSKQKGAPPSASPQKPGPLPSSSGSRTIHRFCTDHLIRCRSADKWMIYASFYTQCRASSKSQAPNRKSSHGRRPSFTQHLRNLVNPRFSLFPKLKCRYSR